MSAIGTVKEIHAYVGVSWPTAIRQAIDLKVRIGYALRNAGDAITHVGDHIISECDDD